VNYSFNVAYIFRSDHCVCVNNKNNRCWSVSLSLSLSLSGSRTWAMGRDPSDVHTQ